MPWLLRHRWQAPQEGTNSYALQKGKSRAQSVFENSLNPRHDTCLDYMPLSQVAGLLSLAMVDGLTRSFSRASRYEVSQ
jgi:hypothetical protein